MVERDAKNYFSLLFNLVNKCTKCNELFCLPVLECEHFFLFSLSFLVGFLSFFELNKKYYGYKTSTKVVSIKKVHEKDSLKDSKQSNEGKLQRNRKPLKS